MSPFCKMLKFGIGCATSPPPTTIPLKDDERGLATINIITGYSLPLIPSAHSTICLVKVERG